MPAERHKRSQNAPVVYTLVDEGATGRPAAAAVVDALMRNSSRTEGDFQRPNDTTRARSSLLDEGLRTRPMDPDSAALSSPRTRPDPAPDGLEWSSHDPLMIRLPDGARL